MDASMHACHSTKSLALDIHAMIAHVGSLCPSEMLIAMAQARLVWSSKSQNEHHANWVHAGCEWDAFKSLHMLKQAGHTPDQLLFEIHLSKEYGIHGEQELSKILTVYDYLFLPDAEGFSFSRFFWHDNIGFNGMRTISDTLLAVGVPSGTCCREMGFVRRNHSMVPLNDRRDNHMQSHHRHVRMHAAAQHQP